jgi:hypothetical protein
MFRAADHDDAGTMLLSLPGAPARPQRLRAYGCGSAPDFDRLPLVALGAYLTTLVAPELILQRRGRTPGHRVQGHAVAGTFVRVPESDRCRYSNLCHHN